MGNNSLELSRTLMRYIDEYLYTKYLNIQGWTKDKRLNGITSGDEYGNIFQFLASLAKIHKEYYYINCLNTDGQVIASNNVDLKGRNMSTDAGFKEALNGNQTMQDVAFNKAAGGYAIVMSTPVWNIPEQSEIIGVLTVAIKWDIINEMITGIEIGGREQSVKNHIMLLNKDGLVISCFDPEEIFTDNLIEIGIKSAKYAQEHKEGYLIETTEHDFHSFSVYTYSKKYKDLPHLHWNLVLYQDAKEVFAVIDTSRKMLIFILMSTVPIIIIIAILFSRRISKPLHAVVLAASAIKNGDLNTKVSIKSNDEIGHLAVSFNQMVEGLKKTNIALKESEEIFRSISSTANDAIIMLDNEGKVSYWNKSAEEIFGFSSEEMLGNEIYETIMPDKFREDHIKGFKVFRDNGQGNIIGKTVEFAALRRDGTEFPIELSLSAVLLNGRWNAIGIVRDITERKHAEKKEMLGIKKLKMALDGAINALALAVEQRDPYTAGHQQRVANLSCAIAEEMKLPPDQTEGIRMSGVIHDIGKMNIPAEILSRPGKLTEAEFNIVKTHAQAGYEILKGLEFPWPVADIVHQHHEHMDGSGYPLGLSDGDILMEARILCVADVVEAMASHRPYRPALGMDMVLEEISEKKGIHFDSDVVDACVKVIKEEGFEFDQPKSSEVL